LFSLSIRSAVAHVPFPHWRRRRWASGFASDDRPLGTLLFPFPTILFSSGCGIEQSPSYVRSDLSV